MRFAARAVLTPSAIAPWRNSSVPPAATSSHQRVTLLMKGYQGHGVLTYALLEALDIKASKGEDDRVRVNTLADHVEQRVPEITMSSFGILQQPTRKLTGNDFPIGIRQAVLESGSGVATVPKEPPHVLIRAELVRENPTADAPSIRELGPGTQVRAVEFCGHGSSLPEMDRNLVTFQATLSFGCSESTSVFGDENRTAMG